MSRQNVEVVRRAHQALNSGDIDQLLAVCRPDIEVDMSDRALNPATYIGHDGIRQFYAEVQEVWESYVWEPEELRDEGNVVLALLRTRGRGRGSGVEIHRRTAMLWNVRDGQAFRLKFYRDPGRAIEAVESRE